MLVDRDVKKLLERLLSEEFARIEVGGFDISIKMFDHGTKLSLSTPVYLGGNYIPKSVRSCLSQKSPFGFDEIKTYLTVDERRFSVLLNYLGTLENSSNSSLKSLVEEFSWLASEWQLYLDEH